MVAGEIDVGKREERGEETVVGGVRIDVGDDDEAAIGKRDAGELGLQAGGLGRAVETAVRAVGLEAFAAEFAGVVLEGEGGDDEVALFDVSYFRADLFDDGDELVAHGAAVLAGGHVVVWVQVRAAHAGTDGADEGVGGEVDDGIRDGVDADITGAVHQCGFHDSASLEGDRSELNRATWVWSDRRLCDTLFLEFRDS